MVEVDLKTKKSLLTSKDRGIESMLGVCKLLLLPWIKVFLIERSVANGGDRSRKLYSYYFLMPRHLLFHLIDPLHPVEIACSLI